MLIFTAIYFSIYFIKSIFVKLRLHILMLVVLVKWEIFIVLDMSDTFCKILSISTNLFKRLGVQ